MAPVLVSIAKAIAARKRADVHYAGAISIPKCTHSGAGIVGDLTCPGRMIGAMLTILPVNSRPRKASAAGLLPRIAHELLHCSVLNHGKVRKSRMMAHLGDYERLANRLREASSVG